MIAKEFQGLGFGKRAVEFVVENVRARGMRELYTSFGEGEGSPGGFYRKLGFVETGGRMGEEGEEGEEVEVVLRF